MNIRLSCLRITDRLRCIFLCLPHQVYNRWFRKNDEVWWHKQERQQRRKFTSLHDHQPALTEAISGGRSEPLLQPKHISNDNDSARQEQHNHLPHGVVNVVRSHQQQRGKHNQPPPVDEEEDLTGGATITTSPSSAAPTARMIANDYHHRYQNAHISKHFCEDNELQSNGNLLLNQRQPHHHQQPQQQQSFVGRTTDDGSRHSFQEPNIIKHTEL